jgi:multiple sugar transport system ATP-binding protein
MNLVTLPLGANGSVSFGNVSVQVPGNGRDRIVVGLRPESLELAAEGLPAKVDVVEEIGADAYVFCTASVAGEETKLVARAGAKRAPERGERVSLQPVAEEAHLFDPVDGARLG